MHQILNGCGIKTSLSASLCASAVLSSPPLPSLQFSPCGLSCHLLQIGIMVTAIINLQSQQLCSLSSTSGTSWNIAQSPKSSSFALFDFFLPTCFLSSFAPLLTLFPTSFLSPFLPLWSLLYFFILSLSPSSYISFVSSPCQFLSPFFHFFPSLPFSIFFLHSSLFFCPSLLSHEISLPADFQSVFCIIL